MRARIVQAELTAAIVAGLFAVAALLVTTSSFAVERNGYPVNRAGDLKLLDSPQKLPRVEEGWILRPAELHLGRTGAAIMPDNKVVPGPSPALIALIIKSRRNSDTDLDANAFKLVDAPGAPKDAAISWSEDRLSLKLLRGGGLADGRAVFVSDPQVYPAPYIAICDGCTPSDFKELHDFLAQQQRSQPLAASPPPNTSPAPTASPRQLNVRIIDDNGNPVDRRWSVSAVAGPCNQRRGTLPSQPIRGAGESIALPASPASEIYCFVFLPLARHAATVDQRCLQLHAGLAYWTPYESKIETSFCPPSEVNVSVEFRVKNGVTADEFVHAPELLVRAKHVTIRNKPLINGGVVLDFADTARPWIPEDVKIANDLYRVDKVEPVSEGDLRQLRITLTQQFVDLNNIKIKPQDSNGDAEPNCALLLAIKSDAVVQRDWRRGIKDSGALEGDKIKISVVKIRDVFQYVLPQSVLDSGLQIRWPQGQPDPPIAISATSSTNPAECNLNLQGEPKIERKFFFGEAFQPIVRLSKPGFEVIATRLDRNRLNEVGLTPATELYFWQWFFNLVDKLDRSNNGTSSRFEWARISQYQGAADSNHEILSDEPIQAGFPLFGNLDNQSGKISEFINKLLEAKSGQSFTPIDVPVELSDTISQMSGADGRQPDRAAKNIIVAVGGPRLGDKGRTCVHLRNDDNALVEALAPKQRNIKLVFLELAEESASYPAGTMVRTDIDGVSECNLKDSKWQDTAVLYVIDSKLLLAGDEIRNMMIDALAKRIKEALNIGG